MPKFETYRCIYCGHGEYTTSKNKLKECVKCRGTIIPERGNEEYFERKFKKHSGKIDFDELDEMWAKKYEEDYSHLFGKKYESRYKHSVPLRKMW